MPPPRRQKQLNKRRRFYQLLLLHLRTDRPEIGRYKSLQVFKSGQVDEKSPDKGRKLYSRQGIVLQRFEKTLKTLQTKLHLLLAKP